MHFRSEKKQSERSRGQVLIESMVALTIVLVGLLGVFALITRSFALTKTVTFEYTAYNLASEGIEIAKNILDRDIYSVSPSNAGLWGSSVSFGSGADYCLSYNDTGFAGNAPCTGSERLTIETATGRYSYAPLGTGQEVTPFHRRVFVKPEPAAGPLVSVFVRSTVEWSSRGRDFTIEVADRFYKWRP